jgi:hypothetical protein
MSSVPCLWSIRERSAGCVVVGIQLESDTVALSNIDCFYVFSKLRAASNHSNHACSWLLKFSFVIEHDKVFRVDASNTSHSIDGSHPHLCVD